MAPGVLDHGGAVPTRLGRYEIWKKLARGGMADLYLARTSGVQGFERYVVVKQILPHLADDVGFVQMFLDEARLAAQLHHHNIAQVHDIGEEHGRYFFAMEYLHGEDVRTLLREVRSRGERLPMEHALAIASGVAAGLHYAHERVDAEGRPLHIVHRDISPSNIIVTYDGGVKLVDFGIARAANRTTETRTGKLKGKLSYMSPEQCLGEELDRRSDIFSLGIVLYELTTSQRLFSTQGQSDYLVMERIVNGSFTPPSDVVTGYPPELEDVVLRALARAPADRYATAEELLLDLDAFARQERLPMSPVSLSSYVRRLVGERPEPWRAPSEPRQSGPAPPRPPTSAPSPPVLPLASPPPTSTAATANGAPTVPALPSRPATQPDGAVHAPRLRPRLPIRLLVALAALAAVLALVLLARSGGDDAARTPAPEPAAQPAATPPDASPADAGQRAASTPASTDARAVPKRTASESQRTRRPERPGRAERERRPDRARAEPQTDQRRTEPQRRPRRQRPRSRKPDRRSPPRPEPESKREQWNPDSALLPSQAP